MQLSVSGKHIDVGESLRGHVDATLHTVVDRCFDAAIEAKVVSARERHPFHADVSVHVARNVMVQSHGEASDAYAAFGGAAARLETRLQRCKGRLLGRRKARQTEKRGEPAQHCILAPDAGEQAEDPEHGQPAVVVEQPSEIASLTVGEAVLRTDLGDQPVLMFRNVAHGRPNVVYRRRNGAIGWIDPQPAVSLSSRPA